jgi:flavin-dependent dehydrogenase
MYDVLIAGGGPAGAVVAYCLGRRGARVAVLEATGYDTPRFGETLPPEINPALRDLGLEDSFRALAPLESPGIISSWGDAQASPTDFVNSPYGTGWHVDRNAFDAMLLREAESAGASVFLRRKLGAARRSSGVWRCDELRAGFLVDASGRNGLKLEPVPNRSIDDVLLAIIVLVSFRGPGVVDLRTYVEAVPSGWWYSTPLPDGAAVAMFFTDRETYRDEGVVLADHLAHAPLTAERLRTCKLERSSVVFAPSSCRASMFGDGWLAVGDSASCYDPLSGRGIFKALRQGAAAAQAVSLATETALTNYADTVRREYDSYWRQRSLYYESERRWESSAFWIRRRKGC